MKYDVYTLTTGESLTADCFKMDPDKIRMYISERLHIEVNRALGVFFFYKRYTAFNGHDIPPSETITSDVLRRGKGGFIAANMAIEIDVLESENWGHASKIVVRIPKNGKKSLRNLELKTA